MEVFQEKLGARIRETRLAAGLTQEQVAEVLGIPRTAIVQIESGKRAVSTLEISRFAQLCHRPVSGFFEDSVSSKEEDVLVALFRAAECLGENPGWHPAVMKYLAICREGVRLRGFLGYPSPKGPPTYPLPKPERTMEAVEQGMLVAEEERRRLGIGHLPISDLSDLINNQNIWASGADLPDPMSGIFLHHSSIGLCILVNYHHGRARKRFSYAHEYGHALMDRERSATVSLEQNRSDLTEVRANAFAASFLMPGTGVWAFLNGRFKAGPSLIEHMVYDPSAEKEDMRIRAQKRAAPGSQSLTFEDVAALAHHFGVSYQAALYRLKSLSIIHASEFNELKAKETYWRMYQEILESFDGGEIPDPTKPDREIMMQVLHLAIESFRREYISQGKLRDLSILLGIPAKKLMELAEAA
jgi:Zn-dependent peptidase ImmA (M78 family)/transcriptional regulator with XRE-family HTH domain